jgi:hypothetical protein
MDRGGPVNRGHQGRWRLVWGAEQLHNDITVR